MNMPNRNADFAPLDIPISNGGAMKALRFCGRVTTADLDAKGKRP